jgi:hypothetical protein
LIREFVFAYTDSFKSSGEETKEEKLPCWAMFSLPQAWTDSLHARQSPEQFALVR